MAWGGPKTIPIFRKIIAIEHTFNIGGHLPFTTVLARAHARLRLPARVGERESVIVRADRVIAHICNGRPRMYLWRFRNAERVECAYPSVKIE